MRGYEGCVGLDEKGIWKKELPPKPSTHGVWTRFLSPNPNVFSLRFSASINVVVLQFTTTVCLLVLLGDFFFGFLGKIHLSIQKSHH